MRVSHTGRAGKSLGLALLLSTVGFDLEERAACEQHNRGRKRAGEGKEGAREAEEREIKKKKKSIPFSR